MYRRHAHGVKSEPVRERMGDRAPCAPIIFDRPTVWLQLFDVTET